MYDNVEELNLEAASRVYSPSPSPRPATHTSQVAGRGAPSCSSSSSRAGTALSISSVALDEAGVGGGGGRSFLATAGSSRAPSVSRSVASSSEGWKEMYATVGRVGKRAPTPDVMMMGRSPTPPIPPRLPTPDTRGWEQHTIESDLVVPTPSIHRRWDRVEIDSIVDSVLSEVDDSTMPESIHETPRESESDASDSPEEEWTHM